MSIRILRPGLLTTVQDLGRWGNQRHGIVVGGAMDTLALRMANLLVGNPEAAAGLEMTLMGPTIRFEHDAVVALCGGEFRSMIDDSPLSTWRPVDIRKGSTLTCGSSITGCRGYLAIGGGIDVPLVLGSRCTYLHGKYGGHAGRALQVDDLLSIGATTPAVSPTSCSWRVGSVAPAYENQPTLRVILGSEFDWLSPQSQEQLCHSEFIVTPQSDRMGYRLSGPRLELMTPRELISTAVCPGVIQVPADGQPILLMADCATTGGYPKAACVASVDLPLAAQLRPGDRVRFAGISLAEAQSLMRQREADIERLKVGLSFKLSRGDHAADSPRGLGG